MSHSACFYTSDSASPKSDEGIGVAVDVGGVIIPLLWSGMFCQSSDIFANNYSDEPNEEGGLLAFRESRDKAIQNLVERKESLLHLIPSEYHQHYHGFLNYLNTSHRKFVFLSIEDIEQMASESMLESAKDWRTTLDNLSQPIRQKRSGLLRYILGKYLPIAGSWQHIWAYTGLDSQCKYNRGEDAPWAVC